MLLVNVPIPVPSVVWLPVAIGVVLVLQHTPLAVILAPPSLVILPPLIAVINVMLFIAVVVIIGSVGGTGGGGGGLGFIFKSHFSQEKNKKQASSSIGL